MVENITYQGELLALIVSHRFQQSGIHFFTPNELSQQLAYMHYPVGKVIQAHVAVARYPQGAKGSWV